MPNAEWKSGASRAIASGGDSGFGEDFFQFARFCEQWFDSCGRQNGGRRDQLQPINRFVDFFFDDSDFRDEIRAAARFATGPIICAHRGPASHQLRADCSSLRGFWNCADHPHNAHRKLKRPINQIAAAFVCIRHLAFGIHFHRVVGCVLAPKSIAAGCCSWGRMSRRVFA